MLGHFNGKIDRFICRGEDSDRSRFEEGGMETLIGGSLSRGWDVGFD